jgi:hypothetical protein
MLSILALALASASPAAPKADAQAAPVCLRNGPIAVAQHKPVRAQRLNELPNADQYLTVLRTENGCSKPVIVNYDIGSAPRKHR